MNTLDIIISTKGPLSGEQMTALTARGLRLIETVGNNTYRWRGTTAASMADVKALDFVTSVDEVTAAQKMDAPLQAHVEAALAAAAANPAVPPAPVKVVVELDRTADVQATLQSLGQLGQVLESTARRAKVETTASQVEALAALDGVLRVEAEPQPRLQNNVARTLTHEQPLCESWGLDGSGEVVGVADTGLDTGNAATVLADFANRIVNIRATPGIDKSALGLANGADVDNHGTHVSGSILGNGSCSNGTLRGMAPAARITMLSMENGEGSLVVPADLTTGVFQDAYNDNARVHSNSWCDTAHPGQYTAYASDVDEFTHDHPDMLIVCAAGNAGSGASTVLPPSTAKNCLTVGACESVRPLPLQITLSNNPQDHDFNPATPDQNVPLIINNLNQQADNPDQIASFSSRGPTVASAGGRIKPEVVAPGSWILSTRSQVSLADVGSDGVAPVPYYADDADGVRTHAEAVGPGLPGQRFFGTWDQTTPDAPAGSGNSYAQNYLFMSGTSMATPLTSGAVALLRQYLRQRRGIANPSAALMKALLVNGATVPAGQSNAPNNDRGFGWLNLESTLAPQPTGQQVFADDVNLAVATNETRSFSVLLGQTGYPLRVTLVWTDAPGSLIQNKLYLRVIAPDGTTFDGDVVPFDPVQKNVQNNVQRVHIAAPVAGTYTVEVHGLEVLHGIPAFPGQVRQDFALAVANGIGFSPKPVEICQVIDISGSMSYYGYIDPVRERGKQLVDMLRINDLAGAVSFNHLASIVYPLTALSGQATQTAIKAAIGALTSSGTTSIGGGLKLAVGELATGNPAHPQAIVLLSDGHENTPPWVGGAVTDSPPAWYNGPDLTEVLPTLPPHVKVYTVSLGVQSDEVLLQEIANLTGGVFHAIYGPSEIGKLHEIYVHLQALAGGEEVLASGSDAVGVIMLGAPKAAAAPAARGNGYRSIELEGLTRIAEADLAGLRRVTGVKRHVVPVDETVTSLTLMVSWHNPQAPVSLSIISPSLRVYNPGDPQIQNMAGSSYQFYRVENPEPGPWTLVVKAKADYKGNGNYTWGAYAATPIGLEWKLPQKIVGMGKVQVCVGLKAKPQGVQSVQFTGTGTLASAAVKDLVERYKAALAECKLPFKPDTPVSNPDEYKLGLLDQKYVQAGKPSLFPTSTQRLSLTSATAYTDTLALPAPSSHSVQIVAQGKTDKGYTFSREARFSLRN